MFLLLKMTGNDFANNIQCLKLKKNIFPKNFFFTLNDLPRAILPAGNTGF